MQDHDWSDLRCFLALHRAGTLSGAGRRIGVSETTIARRLKRLERALGAPLFLRDAQGRAAITDAGQRILGPAEAAEQSHIALREALGGAAAGVVGTVRISSVPVIVNRILVPRLPALRRDHPELMVDLAPDGRNVDLTRREADLAVRFSRPTQGGLQVKAARLGQLSFGAFCAAHLSAQEAEGLGWIAYDDTLAALPQAKWITAPGARVTLRVGDIDTAIEAAATGLGKTLLPIGVASRDPRLRGLSEMAGAFPAREVWLLSHPQDSARQSVRAVKSWLGGITWR